MITINLAPPRPPSQKRFSRLLREYGGAVLGPCVCSYVAGQLCVAAVGSSEEIAARIGRAEQELRQVENQSHADSQAIQTIRGRERQQVVLRITQRIVAIVFASLAETVPSRAFIVGVRFDGPVVELQGFAIDTATLATLMDNVRRVHPFMDVAVEKVERASLDGHALEEFIVRGRIKDFCWQQGVCEGVV